MANPHPNLENLKPFKKGTSGNPVGKRKGTLDMRTRISRMLNADIDWDKISNQHLDKLKERYGKEAVADVMIYIQVSKALTGDTRAFNALRKAAYGNSVKPEPEELPNVVHIYKPEALAKIQILAAAERARNQATIAV